MKPSLDDDPTWAEALASPEWEFWVAGTCEEIQSLQDLQVFVLVPQSSVPSNHWPMHGKLICKCKCNDSGNVTRFKVRYVAKGYAQCYGIDYNKTTAPTACLESFRLLLHFAASMEWELHQFDIKTAFLNGILPDEEVAYTEQPPGFEELGKDDWVWKLMHSIYGMKQASHIWNHMFDSTVHSWGFCCMSSEWCIYLQVSDTGTTIFTLHINDILSTSSSLAKLEHFQTALKSCWDISDLSPANFALGISITQCLPQCTVSIQQSAFIDWLLVKFNQMMAHPCDTSMAAGLVLHCPDKSILVDLATLLWMQHTSYCELVGSLNYLAVTTHPDLTFAVGHLASFLDCYHSKHWTCCHQGSSLCERYS